MKQLPDSGQAFYGINWSVGILGVEIILFSLIFIGNFLYHREFPFLLPMAIAGLIGIRMLYLGFFAPPLCTVYPERLVIYTLGFFRWKQTTLFWDQIKQFYLKEIWIRQGKGLILTKSLILDTATRLTEVKTVYQIKKKERELLFRIFAEHGIPQGAEVKDPNVSNERRKTLLEW